MVDGNIVPVLTGTEAETNLENAVLITGLANNELDPNPPDVGPKDPNDKKSEVDYERDNGDKDKTEGNLRYDKDEEFNNGRDYKLGDRGPNVSLILAGTGSSDWEIDSEFGNLRFDFGKNKFILTHLDGSTEEFDPGPLGRDFGNIAVPLMVPPFDPVTLILTIAIGIGLLCIWIIWAAS